MRSTRQKLKRSEPSQRQQRVGELLRHALSETLMRGELLSEELYDRPLFVGEVRMAADLRRACAYVSFAKQDRTSLEERRAVLDELRRLAPALQKSCAAPLRLKFTPKIVFAWDDLGERSAKIEGILRRCATGATGAEAECGRG